MHQFYPPPEPACGICQSGYLWSKAVGPLSKIWVLVDDVPVGLRSVEFMMAFGKLIGKPVEVDSESLGKVGPVRLNVWCIDPVCVHGSVDVFPSPEGVLLEICPRGNNKWLLLYFFVNDNRLLFML